MELHEDLVLVLQICGMVVAGLFVVLLWFGARHVAQNDGRYRAFVESKHAEGSSITSFLLGRLWFFDVIIDWVWGGLVEFHRGRYERGARID